MTFRKQAGFVVILRLLLAWVFLYAGYHQIAASNWSAGAFLSHTKTFHDVYAWLATPTIDPVLSFMVKYGHIAIGVSLLTGCLVRISAPIGAGLMILYWTAHMDWPFIENQNNFLISYHIVYATSLTYLAAIQAGTVWGLDGWLAKSELVKRVGIFRNLFASAN